MTLEIAKQMPELTRDQLDLVKRTVAQDATDDELRLFLHDCGRRGVHPLDRLIHFTKRGGKYVPITSIDFMRSRAAATGEYAGNDNPVFVYGDPDAKHPTESTVTVWRMVQGTRCAFTATARWSEYNPGQGLDFMWKKMPHVLLSKCAEALALRKGFPQEVAGLYAAEEMDQAKEVPLRIPVPTAAEVTAERTAISDDHPASDEMKSMVATLASKGMNEDAKAVLRNYGMESVKDIREKLTQHIADLVLAAQGPRKT